MYYFSTVTAILALSLRCPVFRCCSFCCGLCPGLFVFVFSCPGCRRGRPTAAQWHGLRGHGPQCGPAAQPLQGSLACRSASLRSVAAAALSWLLAPTSATPCTGRSPRHPLARAGTSWPAEAGLRRAPPRPLKQNMLRAQHARAACSCRCLTIRLSCVILMLFWLRRFSKWVIRLY